MTRRERAGRSWSPTRGIRNEMAGDGIVRIFRHGCLPGTGWGRRLDRGAGRVVAVGAWPPGTDPGGRAGAGGRTECAQ